MRRAGGGTRGARVAATTTRVQQRLHGCKRLDPLGAAAQARAHGRALERRPQAARADAGRGLTRLQQLRGGRGRHGARLGGIDSDGDEERDGVGEECEHGGVQRVPARLGGGRGRHTREQPRAPRGDDLGEPAASDRRRERRHRRRVFAVGRPQRAAAALRGCGGRAGGCRRRRRWSCSPCRRAARAGGRGGRGGGRGGIERVGAQCRSRSSRRRVVGGLQPRGRRLLALGGCSPTLCGRGSSCHRGSRRRRLGCTHGGAAHVHVAVVGRAAERRGRHRRRLVEGGVFVALGCG